MPLSAEEAIVVFSRKVENELERADALRMGLQLVQTQHRRIMQLEQFIQTNNLQIPPMQGQTPMPSNVTPMPTGAARSAPPQGDSE